MQLGKKRSCSFLLPYSLASSKFFEIVAAHPSTEEEEITSLKRQTTLLLAEILLLENRSAPRGPETGAPVLTGGGKNG